MKVFVYGTLKKGYGLNSLLKNAEPLGSAQVAGYKLVYSGDKQSFPFAIENVGTRIIGEVYDIGDDIRTRNSLDGVEGSPNWYLRTKVMTTEGELVEMYVMPKERLPKVTYTDCPNNTVEYEWSRV